MRPKIDMDVINAKMEDLCREVINQPAFAEFKQMIEDFLVNDQALEQYNRLVDRQRMLHQKQHQGLRLTQQEIDDFEEERFQLYENPITRDFMYAQQELSKIQKTLTKYVTKTIELGRLPEESDLDEGGCGCGGGGCGCGGH